jgi:hypothetical protein
VLWTDGNQQLQKMDLQKSVTLSYHLERKNETFEIRKVEQPVETKIKMASGEINGSFYIAGEQAGLSPRTIMNLADIFAWEVDFARELRPGDQFKIIYEKRYLNDQYLGDGEILAAELTVGGQRSLKAFQLKVDDEHLGLLQRKRTTVYARRFYATQSTTSASAHVFNAIVTTPSTTNYATTAGSTMPHQPAHRCLQPVMAPSPTEAGVAALVIKSRLNTQDATKRYTLTSRVLANSSKAIKSNKAILSVMLA